MTKQYKTLFPELNILTLGVIIALPMLVTLLFHFVIDPWVGPDGDDMLSRMFMLLSWFEALIPYFMFDGYSQNEQFGIAYLCSLPNGRKTRHWDQKCSSDVCVPFRNFRIVHNVLCADKKACRAYRSFLFA